MHITWLRVIEVEILIPMNPMSTPSQIDQNDDLVNDYIDSWSEVDSNKTNQYSGPYCETPW